MCTSVQRDTSCSKVAATHRIISIKRSSCHAYVCMMKYGMTRSAMVTLHVLWGVCVPRSQNLTVVSPLPLASWRPSGLKAVAKTASVCPVAHNCLFLDTSPVRDGGHLMGVLVNMAMAGMVIEVQGCKTVGCEGRRCSCLAACILLSFEHCCVSCSLIKGPPGIEAVHLATGRTLKIA